MLFSKLFVAVQAQDELFKTIHLFPDNEKFSINTYIYYFEDTKGTLSFEDISKPEFTGNFQLTEKTTVNFGYTHSTYWARIDIKNTDPRVNDWLLEIDYELLDSIDFFQIGHESEWEIKQFGDMYPYDHRDWDYRTFLIPLQLPDTSINTYYLRFRSLGSMQFPMNIYQAKSALKTVMFAETYYGLFFGIMFLLIIYNAFIYFSLREITYFYYIILILSSVVFMSFMSGHMFQYVFRNSMWWCNKLLPSCIAVVEFSLISLTRSFLSTRQYHPKLDRILIYFLFLSVIQVFLLFFANYHFSARVAAYSCQLYILLSLFSGILILLKGNQAARLFILAFTIYLFGAMALAFNAIGIVGENVVSIHGMELGVMLNGVILSLALINRYKISKTEKEKADKEIILMREKATEKLEQKVVERTKEIRDKNEELRQQQEELTSINEVLENQKEELQRTLESLRLTQSQLIQSEKMASIGQLVAGIAHEINNPVNFINAGVDSLNENLEEIRQVLAIYHRITTDNVEEKLQEIDDLKNLIDYHETIREVGKLIDTIQHGTKRTTEIVKGLRTFSRLDEDVLKVADLHEGLDSTLILLHNRYKDKIELVKEYGKIPEIDCYPGQLNQVFMNVLSNAIEAIEDKGKIIVSTSISNGSIRISIKDTGTGIPEDIRSRIFEPFFSTKEIGQGTGLGLSICHSIIERHRGSIEVRSEMGTGSEFVIILPIKQPLR